jgi:predicted RNA-binding protein with PUA-like domain
MPKTPRKFWLLKSEPTCYSIDDFARDGVTHWSGVRNYQARNFMRDEMKPGDGVLFYHSSAEPPGIAGVAEIASAGYGDHTALDPKDDHFDPKTTADEPIWVMVDVKFVRKFDEVISTAELKSTPGLEEMLVLRRGQRLSVMPVTEAEWRIVEGLRPGSQKGRAARKSADAA